MALKYNVQLNNGVEAFGTGKSITANGKKIAQYSLNQ